MINPTDEQLAQALVARGIGQAHGALYTIDDRASFLTAKNFVTDSRDGE